MNKSLSILCLLFLNLSCVEKKSSTNAINKSEFLSLTTTDSLKFTSGIRSIFQDKNGNYWFGSHTEGISYYDGKSFKYFDESDGLSDNQIRSIQEDPNGNIWIGTSKGVSSYNGKSFTNYHTKSSQPNLQSENSDSFLWFSAGNNPGINLFDGLNLNYLPFSLSKNQDPHNSYGVTDISKGSDGKVWIATYTSLLYFDGKSIHPFDENQLTLEKGERLHIRSVLADSKGRIWIGNNGIGALLFQDGSAVNFSDKNGLVQPKSSKNGSHSPPGTLEHVFVIKEDSAGNIWFGDRDTGAWKYDGETITNYTIDDSLTTPMIWSIYKDRNNNLLFGMEAGGVYVFNGESFNKKF